MTIKSKKSGESCLNRDALDDDAVFNVVGEVLPAAHVERVRRDYYAGKGDARASESS